MAFSHAKEITFQPLANIKPSRIIVNYYGPEFKDTNPELFAKIPSASIHWDITDVANNRQNWFVSYNLKHRLYEFALDDIIKIAEDVGKKVEHMLKSGNRAKKITPLIERYIKKQMNELAVSLMNQTPKQPVTNMREAFSYTTTTAGQTWDPTQGRSPFNVQSGTGFLDNLLNGKAREEEAQQKAPKTLPFPLDRVIEQMVAAYEKIMAIRVTLVSTIKTAILTDAEKEVLRKEVKRLDSYLDGFKESSKEIEKLKM